MRLNNCGTHVLCLRSSCVAPLIKRQKYTISFTNTLFRRSFLNDLLSSGYSLWELEKLTPERFFVGIYAPSIFLLSSPIVSQSHVLRRGRIVSYAKTSRSLSSTSSIPLASPFYRIYHDLHALLYPLFSTLSYGLTAAISLYRRP